MQAHLWPVVKRPRPLAAEQPIVLVESQVVCSEQSEHAFW